MPVMPAGMHPPVVCARVCQFGPLDNRQRVDVRPHATQGLFVSPIQAMVAVGAVCGPTTYVIPSRSSSSRIAAAVLNSSYPNSGIWCRRCRKAAIAGT